IGAEFFQLILNAPGCHVLIASKQIYAPYGVVRKVFLDVREPGYSLAFHQVLAIAEFCVAKKRSSVAKRARNLHRLVKFNKLLLQIDRLLICDHRALSAGANDGIEFVYVDLGGFLRVLRKCKKFWSR